MMVNGLMEYLINSLCVITLQGEPTAREPLAESIDIEYASEGKGHGDQATDMHALQNLPGHLIAEDSGNGSFKKTELNLGFDALRMWAGNAMQEERSDHASQHRCTIQCDQNVL